jgi:hypothetical protein
MAPPAVARQAEDVDDADPLRANRFRSAGDARARQIPRARSGMFELRRRTRLGRREAPAASPVKGRGSFTRECKDMHCISRCDGCLCFLLPTVSVLSRHEPIGAVRTALCMSSLSPPKHSIVTED